MQAQLTLGNMDQFPHFHCSNLKIRKYSSIRIFNFNTTHHNSHEISKNSPLLILKLIFAKFDKKGIPKIAYVVELKISYMDFYQMKLNHSNS